ncbi:MAG: metallophosphatase family protein, partial [Actinomycetota bacterium]|nr:metallophosphatase family protein [Actinomycetota bacterium]
MRIAVLTDAQGNLPALEAALAMIRAAGSAAIYHTGNAVGIGPYPAECVERLLGADVRCVRGNHEAYALDRWPCDEASGMGADEVAHHAWVRGALGSSLREAVACWPWALEEGSEGARVAFLHYPLDASGRDFRPVVADPSAAALDSLFADYRTDLAFYGHNHAASDIQGRARYVNPGSLGCYTAPLARFVTLDLADRSYTLTEHAAPYDDSDLLRAFDERRVP